MGHPAGYVKIGARLPERKLTARGRQFNLPGSCWTVRPARQLDFRGRAIVPHGTTCAVRLALSARVRQFVPVRTSSSRLRALAQGRLAERAPGLPSDTPVPRQRSHGLRGKLALLFLLAAVTAAPSRSSAQSREETRLIAQRERAERELEAIAVIDRKLTVPMRDGTRLATDVYRPRNASPSRGTGTVVARCRHTGAIAKRGELQEDDRRTAGESLREASIPILFPGPGRESSC